MTKREKVIEILKKHSVFTCNPPTYHERQFIRPEDLNVRLYNHCELADKILALDEVLSEEEIEQILYDKSHVSFSGHNRIIPDRHFKDVVKALSGRIAKPQEPKCTCRPNPQQIGLLYDESCPLHGRKVGRLEYEEFKDNEVIGSAVVYEFRYNIKKCMDEINKLNGEWKYIYDQQCVEENGE